MHLGRGEDVQSRSVSGISPSLDIELLPESAKVLRRVIDNWGVRMWLSPQYWVWEVMMLTAVWAARR